MLLRLVGMPFPLFSDRNWKRERGGKRRARERERKRNGGWGEEISLLKDGKGGGWGWGAERERERKGKREKIGKTEVRVGGCGSLPDFR